MLKQHCSHLRFGKRILNKALLSGGVLSSVLSGIPIASAQFPPIPQQNTQQPAVQQTPQAGSKANLQVYTVPSDYVGIVGAQLQIKHHGDPRVSITTDPKTGQLMVMAPGVVQQQISKEVGAFMQQNNLKPGDRGVDVASTREQKYKLQNLSWRELEDAIKRLAGPKMSVELERDGEIANLRVVNSTGRSDVLRIDRRLNEVIMLGSNVSIAGWSQVIYSLDQGQADQSNNTHIVPLAPAEPRGLKRAIRLVSTTAQQQGANGGQAQAQVDVGGNGDQATAIGTLDDLSSSSGLFGDVQIEFIDELGVVIVRGSSADVKRTLEVIEKIKAQAAETQPEVEVFPLQHSNDQAVAALVTDLYENIFEPRQGAVSITALGQPNALLLIGRKEVVQSVKELVSKIDQPLDPQNQLKVIRLLNASAVDVEERIREFFVENPGADDGQRSGLGTRVKVIADFRTNSLIVQASPREMVEVEKLIDDLDVESTTAENAVRVFRLKNTLAEDLQAVISEVITGEATGAGGGQGGGNQVTPPSGKLSIVTVDGGKVESGILAGVVVTADPTVNALVVRAPSESMALIEKLINELDQLPSAEARIKVFELQNGDATSLATMLQQLFGLPATAGQSTTGGLFGLGNLNQAALTTGGEGSLVQLQITVDTRTNSIIVSGSESDLEVIEVLLLRLDEDGVEARRTEVIWLRNANADDVATALNTYLQNQRIAVQQTLVNGGVISLSEQVDREVFVVAEPQTNSLLLSASPRYYDTILSVIERLDRRPPLVSVQVLIAEVQLDDSLELGTEWGLQDGLLFDRQSSTGGTLGSPVFNLGNTLTGPSGGPGITQNVAGQALSSFGVGRQNAAGLGGLVLSASSEAVGVLIRALQTSGRLQILNRPTITTLDSREANTLVGQLVPRVQGVTQAQFGQTVNAEDVEVGLGLAVLPRVNQDGLILMQVQVQNSSVGDVNSGIPVGFGPTGEVIRSPIINTTQATTTVSAYSGQTVVFAGLISKTRGSNRSQIPILGSLPFIGPAFRFDTETEQRRELMVVLTPRIIQSDEDYEVLKQVESSRMSWCLADILNMHGDVGLSAGNGLWGPAKSSVIYPDMQPSAIEDRSTPRVPGMMQPMIIDGYPVSPGFESGAVVEPANAPVLDGSVSTQRSGVPMQTVGFQTSAAGGSGMNNTAPAMNGMNTPAVQQGGYR